MPLPRTAESPADGAPSGSWWRRLPTGFKAACGVVIMLGAVAAALTELGIRKEEPPVSRGELSEVRRIAGITLGEYKIRAANAPSASVPSARVRLVADVAQTPDQGTTTPDPGTATPDPGTATPDPGTTTPDPGTETPDPGTATPDPGTETPDPGTPAALQAACGDGNAGVPLIPGTSLKERNGCDTSILRDAGLFTNLVRGQLRAVDPPDLSDAQTIQFGRFDDLEFHCVAPLEGQVSCVPEESFPPDARAFPDTEEGRRQAARFAVTMLKQVRSRPAGGRRREAVGVLVTYHLRLIGFDGERVTVGWSLYTPKAARLPEDWMFSRRAAVAEADRQDDSAVDMIWVPLPRRRGPYFIRLSVYDDQGIELDNADTRKVE